MTSRNDTITPFAVVMAAGSSQRFGATKQLVEMHGVALVRHAMRIAESVCGARSLLVLGHAWRDVLAAAAPDAGFFLYNDCYSDGLGSSLALAARTLAKRAPGLLVVFADQPLVTAEHVQALADAWDGDADHIVATAFDGSAGPPILLPRGCFEALAALDGDHGAKRLMSDPRYRVTELPFEPAAVDIDTPADLRRI